MPTALTDVVQKAVLSVTPGKLCTLHKGHDGLFGILPCTRGQETPPRLGLALP